MAGERSESEGGGAPGAVPGAGKESGGGGQGGGSPAGGAAGSPAGGTQPAGAVRGIPREALPAELRDLPEAQLALTLNNLVTSVRTANEKNKSLEDKIKEIETRSQPKEPEAPAKPKKPISELIFEDPEAALEQWAEERGYVSRIATMESSIGETTLATVGAKLPDFDEYEGEVRAILKRYGSQVTAESVMGAYTMAVGAKTLQEKLKTRGTSTTDVPANAPPPPEPPKDDSKVDWSPLEEEIRVGMGISVEDYKKHRGDDRPTFIVPTGKKGAK